MFLLEGQRVGKGDSNRRNKILQYFTVREVESRWRALGHSEFSPYVGCPHHITERRFSPCLLRLQSNSSLMRLGSSRW